ncbi:MAG: hypothetical protein K6C94_06320 [Candidatus Gastranaerophilales bacterium]|nr:hypothetical protein [Candidatus Gastranaerophilales bacterium]
MKKIKVFFIIVFILFPCIGLINYFANPFGVFDTNTSFTSYNTKFERYTIYPELKLKDEKADYAIFGSSNTNTYVNTEMFKEATGKTFYDVSILRCTFLEMYYLIDAYYNLYPDEKMIISIEFDPLNDEPEASVLDKMTKDTLTSDELTFLLFSQNAVISSVKMIYDYLNMQKQNIKSALKRNKYTKNLPFIKDYKYCYRKNEKQPRLRYDDWNTRKINKKNFITISKIKKYVDNKKIDAIFYMNPLNAYAIADIYMSGTYGEIEKAKRELVKITPFYDFLYVSKYNDKPVSTKNLYWRDPFHAEDKLGVIMIKSMLSPKRTYGVLVTKDNIESVLRRERFFLEEFLDKHKTTVKKYRSFEDEDYTESYELVCE